MNIFKKSLMATAICLLTAIPTQAVNKTPVTLELVLSVDSSRSIHSSEYKLQRNGYANAFRDREVISAIENLPLGIAITMQLWTSETKTSMDWYHLTRLPPWKADGRWQMAEGLSFKLIP